MSEAAQNLETLLSLYEGDRVRFFERLDPGYVCHTPGGSPVAGRFVGPDGMRAHGAQMRALSDGTFRAKPYAPLLVDASFGMAPVRISASRQGRELSMKAFGIWRFKDGRVMEHWENPLDLAAFDAFWS